MARIQAQANMQNLRKIHLYLGCLFAPLLLYYATSGAWQVFRLNDQKKDAPPSVLRSFLHELSNPHTHSTAPGLDPKTKPATLAFKLAATAAAVALILTTLLGIFLALQLKARRRAAIICLILGLLLPLGFLFL